MKIAYIVAVHRDLRQVERLLRRLAGEDTMLVVHVDRRAGDEEFDELRRCLSDLDVVYLERHRGYWGGFGVVRAALKGIRHLVDNDVAFDYAALLSGQDYPIRPTSDIRETLRREPGRSFMSYFPLPFDGWGPRGGLDRVEDWHLVWRFALHLRLPPRKRRIPGGLVPYGGGRPWILARRAVAYVDEVVRANPELVHFFEHSLHPDELVFQTILLNSALAPTIVPDHRHYVRWRGGPSPATLTVDDLDDLLASDCLFARKFDPAVDAEILDRLDERHGVAVGAADG